MKRRNTLHPTPEERTLRLKDQLIILSRRDRMGKAMPTWYRVLAVVLLLTVGLVAFNGSRRRRLENRTVSPEPLINGTVRLTFTGDLDLSRNVAVLGEKLGYTGLFTGVSPLWQDSALVFSCLDGVVLPGLAQDYPAADGAQTPNAVTPEALSAAADAGVNTLSLANDHSLDFGSGGLARCVQAVNDLGL